MALNHNNRTRRKIHLSDFNLMLLMGVVFAALAVGLWLATGFIFYLYNFSIIGGSLMLGMGLWPLLPRKNKHWARRLSQVLVGGYMFFGLDMSKQDYLRCRNIVEKHREKA